MPLRTGITGYVVRNGRHHDVEFLELTREEVIDLSHRLPHEGWVLAWQLHEWINHLGVGGMLFAEEPVTPAPELVAWLESRIVDLLADASPVGIPAETLMKAFEGVNGFVFDAAATALVDSGRALYDQSDDLYYHVPHDRRRPRTL